MHQLSVNGLSGSVEATSLAPPLPSMDPALAAQFTQLLPSAATFKPVGQNGVVIFYEAYDSTGMQLGYAFNTSAQATSDDLQVLGIVDLNYTIVAVNISPVSGGHLWRQSIAQPAFENQFVGLSVNEIQPAPAGKIDAITGATESSDAVIAAISQQVMEITQTKP